MGAEHIVDAFQNALFDHCSGAFTGFLGRLEDELHGACKGIFDFVDTLYRAQEHGVVRIVTAGVHTAILTGKWQTCVFFNRQAVDIAAQKYRLSRALAALDLSQNAGRLHALVGNAHFVELFADPVRCLEFLHGKLRILMYRAAVLNHIIFYRVSKFICLSHRNPPF